MLVLATPPARRTKNSASVQLTYFQVTSAAATATYPFSIGVGLKKGDAPSNITTDLANAQVVVKRRWNDGSVKHAIVSGRAALTQNVAKTVNVLTGTQAGGAALTSSDIQTAAPTASAQCGAFGTVNLASLFASPVRTWVSGSEMVECHYRADVGGGTLLSVWFHVRLFVDGRKWVRAIVENGYLDNGAGALASNADRSYVPTITIGGVVVYNNGGLALSHYKNTRYSAEGWIGGDPQVTPQHDVAYLRSTKLVPNYHWTSPSASALNALTQTYTQMGRGDIEENMGAGGFSPGIGLLPTWDALYAASGDARAWRSSLANSSNLNSYATTFRSKSSNLPVKPSDFSTWTLDGPGGGGNDTTAAGSFVFEIHHHNSGGYLAYLLTGDYWHYETLALLSSLLYLAIPNSRGSGLNRVVQPGQPRGTGWCIRTLGQFAAIAPEGDAIAADYRTWLENGLTDWKQRTELPGSSQIGYPFADGPSNEILTPPQYYWVKPWMYHFWMQALGHVWDLEPGLVSTTNHQALRDFMYQGAVGILGPNGSSNYCFTNASTYAVVVNTGLFADFTWMTAPEFLQTWGEIFEPTFGAPNTSCANTLQGASGGDPNIPNGYWGNLMPAIAFAVDHGAAGAQAAWDRLVGATNWATLRDSGFDDVPNWGITPRSWAG